MCISRTKDYRVIIMHLLHNIIIQHQIKLKVSLLFIEKIYL